MSNANTTVISETSQQTSAKSSSKASEFEPSSPRITQEEQNTSTVKSKNPSSHETSHIKVKSIGNYILGKTLGEGAFGKVKLATHILTGEKVAIKILEKIRIIDVADVERVAREIYILKYIRHPNMVQLYEIIETPDQLFLVTEYISGGELFDYIVAKNRVEEKEASRFFFQIIAGVDYINKLRIVHRDLKPENLLLDYNKNIKIVDFGLSNIYNENELLKTACGSPCYAAPEMIGGKKYSGLQVDIWSCGIILFAIVCGFLPFEDPNTAVLYKKILSGDYKIPKFVSEEGKDLISKILTIDPAKRITIENIRKHPWMNQIEQPKISEGVIIGHHQTPIDNNIMKQLEQYGFDLDNAQKCLDANKRNHVTTTYYLLLKRFHQSGGRSPADINSDNFDETLLMPKPKTQQIKTNNYMVSMDTGEDGHEMELDTEREENIDTVMQRLDDQSGLYDDATFQKNKAREIKMLYNSILDSSRDRLPTAHSSSKESKILKPNLLEATNEIKRRPSLVKKTTSSPTRSNLRDDRASRAGNEDKEVLSAQLNMDGRKPQRLFNKSFNNKVFNDKIREIYKSGRERSGSRSKVQRGDSYDGSAHGVFQSFNQELLNDSFKTEPRDVNNSLLYPIQSRPSGQGMMNTSKKQPYVSIQTTPKKEKNITLTIEVIHHGNDKTGATIAQIEKKYNPYLRGLSFSNNNADKTRMNSQSPSRLNQILPKEPSYLKPRDSSVNAYRSKLHSRKNSSKPAVQFGEEKAWRPNTNQLRSRERGKSIGVGEDSMRSQNIHEGSFNIGNGSFILNSNFQKHAPDLSFDYSSHQGKAYINGLHRKMSIGGGQNQNRAGRSMNLGYLDMQKKSVRPLLNKDDTMKY